MKNHFSVWKNSLPISLFFVFTVVLYGPYSLFLPNAEEFGFSLGTVTRLVLPFSLAVFAGLCIGFLILPEKINYFCQKLFFGVALAFYIQGNYININYGNGVLDGADIAWSQYRTYGIINVIVWAGCIALPFIISWFLRKKEGALIKVLAVASLFFTVIQIPAFIAQGISYRPNENTNLSISSERMFELGTQDNIIIFIVDTMDEEFYKVFLEEEPDYTERLDGFVHYDNTLASGARTPVAVPSMFTGIPFTRTESYSQYKNRVWSGKNSLSVLHDAGYEIGCYSETVLFSEACTDYFYNFHADGPAVGSWWKLLKKLYKLDLYKFAPHYFKKYLRMDTADFAKVLSSYVMRDASFIQKYRKNGFSIGKKSEKKVLLYHLRGAHNPFNVGRDGTSNKDSTREDQVAGVMGAIGEMLDQLKELGMYDPSTIIITADHGHLNKAEYPILLLKQSNAVEPYETSHAPVSLFDLPVYLAGLVGQKLDNQIYGENLIQVEEGEERERHFFQFDMGSIESDIHEYICNGDVDDEDSLTLIHTFKDSDDSDASYELGTILSFGVEATGNKYLVDGYGKNTGMRTALCGTSSKISIPIRNLSGNGDLIVDMEFSRGRYNEFILKANGLELLHHTTSTTISATVPYDLVSETGVLDLELDFPEVPKEEMEKEPTKRASNLHILSMSIRQDGAVSVSGQNLVATVFNRILKVCNDICHNYGLAIILFTLISKVLLLPVSIWVQKNSIKMVKMMPALNRVRIKYFGDKDTIAEEEQKIYKAEGYNAFASVIPTVIQIVILLGLISAIRVNMRDGSYNTMFLGFDLSAVPAVGKGMLILSPLLAGASSLLLSVASNRANVLQAEQGKGMQIGTMAVSVGISLWLGWFVPVGVAVYWVSSNLFSILQMYLLNYFIDPRKVVDYEELEASREELNQMARLDTGAERSKEDVEREKADYKRFFHIENKHLVFYSESSGFYKYFKGVIEYLLRTTKVPIHYITSDPRDAIFRLAETEPRIKPYYIGEKRLITLMMKMDADIVVMTMPDLENFHIKRSYVRKDIQYIFIPHSMCSLNLTMRTASIDHFDTIFCTGKHQVEETRKTEAAYGLPPKKLVEWGYCLLDEMRADYRGRTHLEKAQKSILVAPSWQKDNIVDSCLDEILESLRGSGYHITVRPHPQHVRHQPEKMEMLKTRFAEDPDIEIQTDFSSNDTVFEADLMITDWSGIAYEYSFTTYKPVLFVDTPVKVMNPEYQRIDTEPFNIWMREILGRVVKPEEAGSIRSVVEEMFAEEGRYHETIRQYAQEYVYNLDHSSEVGGKYITEELRACIRKRKGGSLGGAAMAVLFLASMLFFGENAQAYIDPSVMTYLIQAVAGLVIAVGAVVGIYWRRARKKLQKLLGLEEKKEIESDDIFLDSPEDVTD